MTVLGDAVRFARDREAFDPTIAGICAAAVAIIYEDPETDQHEARAQLAARVLREPAAHAESFLWAISTNATVVGKWVSGDRDGAIGDLAFVIATVWNAVAGAPASTA